MSTTKRVLRIRELDPDMISPSTKTYNNPSQGGSKIVIIGKPGCFIKGTQILMYDGAIKNIEDVQVGDIVMGDDSTPRNVLELCHDREQMYKIESTKGDSYIVNEGHKLLLRCSGNNNIKKDEIVEITVKDYLDKSKEWKNRHLIYRTGVDFQEKKINIEPYLLGLWLGECDLFDHTRKCDSFDPTGDKTDWFKIYCENKKGSYSDIKGENSNAFLNELKKYNLINNKHIPHDFKINSRENRLKLLAGIIDTDGYYDINGKGYEVIQKSEKLIDDIIFLARSLGFSSFKKSVIKGYFYKNEYRSNNYYKTFISGSNIHEIPCLLKRKHAQKRNINKNHLSYKFKVIPIGEDEYFGFILDDNHRFLLASFDVVRNTGKSTMITSLLHEKSHIFPCATVFSGTEDSNHHYATFIPNSFVYNKLDKEKVKDFIKRQKISKEHLPNPWNILLIDDCMDDPRMFTDPIFQGLFKNGRHWKCLFILSLQYSLDVKPVIRTNIDGTFILRETNLRNRRALWENYAGVIPDFSDFCTIMDQITNDYTALYIHNATTSNNLEDCLFWYKAKPISKNFRLGSDDFWSYHKSRYNEEYVDPVV
jgi:hypothetical protein